LGVDAYKPFPHLSNKSLNILVQLEQKKEELTAIVPIPSLLDRYTTLEVGKKRTIILTEDIIVHFVSALFTGRSEEHTSELQSRFDLVCRLLLEKKKQ